MCRRLLYSLPLLCLALFVQEGSATHNRAGEITYEHMGGTNYRFTITTCTKSSAPADRPSLEIRWGDGSGVDSIPRTNVTSISGYDAQINTYVADHSFPGSGSYTISVEDPNRNSNVVNIPNSVSKSFCIQTHLVISGFSQGHNNSVQFTKRACNELACEGKVYKHNVGAYDPDGDSLAYELIECKGNACDPIPDYAFPDQCNGCQPGANNNISIDQKTGDLIWDAPQVQGEYNVAVKVKEYDENGSLRGWVIRDMQIKVLSCNDDPPELNEIEDTCVVAGTKLEKLVSATDPDAGETITLEATGEPLLLQNSPATFPQGVNSSDSVAGTFEWQTTCGHVRPGEYQVLFEARDQANPVALVDFSSFFIKVVAPAPQNPSATPAGNSMELEWDKSICNNASGYRIYRRLGTYGYNPDDCETGVPAYTGYQQIGETNDVNDTTFVDDGNLIHGQQYCYMVTAWFDNGAESIASIEFCGELIKDVPIITHASVGVTDPSNGIDTVRWAKPTELDTSNQYPGPYHYEIYRDQGYGSATNFVGSTDTSALLAQTDTNFIDFNVPTESTPHSYRVELHSDGDYVGETNVASTIFLDADVNDERVFVQWDEQVPWTNHEYELYRSSPGSPAFTQIATTTEQEYLDSNVENGEEYCYLVKSIGSYSAPGLVDPIINFSQEACVVPEDLNAPCGPEPDAEPDCPQFLVDLFWENADPSCGCPEPFWPEPDPQCNDDVAEYRLYRKPTRDGEYVEVASGGTLQDSSFRYYDEHSIAGCYALTAIDSSGNEGSIGDSVCVDNCPIYELPNVFTPNSDGVNDLFVPVKYRYIDKVEFSVRNRWGQEVFSTSDPELEWDGTHQESGEDLSEGVYYYVCIVHTIRLEGTVEEERTGQIQLLRGDPQRKP